MAGAQDTHSWTAGEVKLERKGPECPSREEGKWMWGVLLKPLALVTLKYTRSLITWMPGGGPEERWETSARGVEGAGRSLQMAGRGCREELCAWRYEWAWHRARSERGQADAIL